MSQLNINIGQSPNDKKGDTLRVAFSKVNSNFTEVYASLASLSNVIAQEIPSQTGHAGTVLSTDGTNLVWSEISINALHNGSKTFSLGSDGYLTGESLFLQGYLKGVDGSTGSSGQVLTRQSNGGVAWADATVAVSTGDIRFDGSWIKNVSTGNIYISPQDGNTWLQLPSDTQAGTESVTLANSDVNGQVTIQAGSKYWQFNNDGTTVFPNGSALDFASALKFATKQSLTQNIDLRNHNGCGFYTDTTGLFLHSNNTYEWKFGVDGNLALAGDVNFKYGGAIFEGGHSLPGRSWRTGLNIVGSQTTSTDPIRIYPAGGDGKGLGAGAINVKSDRVEIYGDNQGESIGVLWTFAHNGTLTFPSGAGFGLGNSGQLKVNDGVTLSLDMRDQTGRGFYTDSSGLTLRSNGTYNWIFDESGILNLPNSVTGEPLIQGTNSIQLNADGSYFTFGADGSLTLPTNGSKIVGVEGVLNLYDDSCISLSGIGQPVVIQSTPDNITYHNWTFGLNGNLTFPTGNVQTDAWTGSVDANTLTGTTLNSGVVNSSLTSVGQLTSLVVTGTVDVNSTEDSINADTGALQVAGGATIGKNLIAQGTIYAGHNAYTEVLTNPLIVASSPANASGGYSQVAILNNTATASGDYQVFVDGYDINGPAGDTGWVDTGIAGSSFSDPRYTITNPQDGYLFSSPLLGAGAAGNLVLATDNTGTVGDIVFATGGFTSGQEKMRLKNSDGSLNIVSGLIKTNNNLTLQASGMPNAITAITYSSGGWDGVSGVNIPTTGGTGSGLFVDVDQDGSGYANFVGIVTAGHGYTDGDTITATRDGSSVQFTISILPAKNWTFGADGTTTFPKGGSILDISGYGPGLSTGFFDSNGITVGTAPGNDITFTPNNGVGLYSNGNLWTFGTGGILTLPISGDIQDSNGNSVFASTYTLPKAVAGDGVTTGTLGGVIPDGTTITIDANGVISSTGGGGGGYSLPTASTTTLGGVKIDGTTITINNGIISAVIPTNISHFTNDAGYLTSVTTITGNAGTATKLASAVTINGVSFDGSGNIVVTAAASTLSGNTLAAGVTQSSLTSLGTLVNLTVTNPITGSVTGSAGSAPAGALTGSTLASGVTSSSLTSVGTLIGLTVTNPITGSVTGNAGTVTNGVYTSGSYADPSWITSLAYSKLTGAPNLSSYATSSQVATLQTTINTINSNYVSTGGSYANPTWITSLAYSKLTGAPTLATVATSGSYADLTNKPTIPTTVTINGTAVTLGSSGTVTAAAGTLTGGTLASNVLASSLTSVGTLTSLTSSGNVTVTGSGKFVGDGSQLTNVTVTQQANIVGSQPNVTLVAGSYSYLFDNAGNFTMPTNGDILVPGASGNITIGNTITACNTGTTGGYAFIAGPGATNQVALGIQPTAGTAGNMAIRDNSTIASTIFYDVSIGGTNNGVHSFRGTSSYTQYATIGQYGISLPTRPAFRVYGAGTTNNLSTTQNTNGVLNSNNWAVDYQQGSALNGTTGVFTAPVAGLYQVNLIARTSSNTGVSSQILVQKNSGGTLSTQIMIEWAANTTMNHTGGNTIVKMAVGDTLVLKVALGTINFDANDNWSVAFIG